MKATFFLIIGLIMTGCIYSQQSSLFVSDGEITIPIGYEVEILITETDQKIDSIEIVSEKEFPGRADFLKLMEGFRNADNTQSEGISIKFCVADCLGKDCVLLVMTNHYSGTLNYKATIMYKNGDVKDTSVVPVPGGLPSVEQWFNDIEVIKLYDFDFE